MQNDTIPMKLCNKSTKIKEHFSLNQQCHTYRDCYKYKMTKLFTEAFFLTVKE